MCLCYLHLVAAAHSYLPPCATCAGGDFCHHLAQILYLHLRLSSPATCTGGVFPAPTRTKKNNLSCLLRLRHSLLMTTGHLSTFSVRCMSGKLLHQWCKTFLIGQKGITYLLAIGCPSHCAHWMCGYSANWDSLGSKTKYKPNLALKC